MSAPVCLGCYTPHGVNADSLCPACVDTLARVADHQHGHACVGCALHDLIARALWPQDREVYDLPSVVEARGVAAKAGAR